MIGAGPGDQVSGPVRRTRPGRARRILPTLVTAAAAAAAIAAFVLNPGSFDTAKMRINALLAPDPTAPAPEHRLAGHSDMFGPGDFIAIPVRQEPDSARAESATGGSMDSTLGVRMPSSGAAGTPIAPQDTGRIEAPADAAQAVDPEPPAVERKPPAPAVGYLDIVVEPEAAIYIDGEQHSHGTRLGPVELTVGEHEILCERDGYREYSESITIKKNEMSKRRILLQTVTGSVHFDTQPGVMVYVNGTYKGLTPMGRPLVLPSGSCRIELKKAGYTSWSSEVYIPPDEVVWLNIKLTPQ